MKIYRVAVLVLGTWPASTMAGFASPRPHDVARRSRRGFAALSAHRGGEPTERTHHAHHADPITATSSGYAPKSRGRPWRSVISRVLPYRRNANSGEGGGSGSSSSSVMQMKRLEDESYVMAHPMNDTTSFILRSFQESSPLDVFGNIDLVESAQQDNDFASLMNRNSQKKRPTIDSSSSPSPSTDLSSLASSLSQSTIASTMENIVVGVESTSKNKSYEGGSPLTRVARLWFQNVLHGLLCRWAVEQPEALQVRVAPSGNVLGRLLTKGQLRLNAEIHFDRLVFPNICLSGGSIAAKRMTLNVWSFAPNVVRFSIPRYDSQFEISATNCTFTQADLLKSSCIRNGLRNLLIRILKGRGIQPSHVVVNSLDILPSGKLSCRGQATSLFGAPIHFEVRSGISLASRGHVLTFPGLEISLGNAYLFMPVVPEVDLDIGHNARIRDILIDGQKRLVRMSASATICPKHTIKLSQYIQSTDAYSALFSVDVGKWLTQIGRFTH